MEFILVVPVKNKNNNSEHGHIPLYVEWMNEWIYYQI